MYEFERFGIPHSPETPKKSWEIVPEEERARILEFYRGRLDTVLKEAPERERLEHLRLIGMSQTALDQFLDLGKKGAQRTMDDNHTYQRLEKRRQKLEEKFEKQEAAEKARWVANANEMILNEQANAGLKAEDLVNPTEETKCRIRKIWMEKAAYASGKLIRAKDGTRSLIASPDFDIIATLGILNMAGIKKTVDYVEPGKGIVGGLNIDFGNKMGFAYDALTKTAHCDHHGRYKKRMRKRSSAEIMYTVLAGQHLFPEGATYEKFISFVTKMDNYQLPPEEYVRSYRTAVGHSRSLSIEKLMATFSKHSEELVREFDDAELKQLGLLEESRKEHKKVDDSIVQAHIMSTELSSAYQRDTAYGKVLLNEYNILAKGARPAYLCNDGIINLTPEKSFNVSFKNARLNRNRLRENLHQHDPNKKFQGEIIHGSIWMYNGRAPLELTTEDILAALQ